MIRLPELNFPAVELRRIERDGRTYVPDVVRGGYLVLTPEEWVRRHVIGYLTGYCGVELQTVMTEYPVDLNGTPQRADVVVADTSGRPLILVECKAPDVRITREVLAQAVRYNSVLHARYIILTNGMKHFCFEHAGGGYVRMSDFPRF